MILPRGARGFWPCAPFFCGIRLSPYAPLSFAKSIFRPTLSTAHNETRLFSPYNFPAYCGTGEKML